MFVSIICILIGWTSLTNLIGFHSDQVVKVEQKITIMSYNMRYLYSIGDMKGNEKLYKEQKFRDDIREWKPIIFCAQESGAYARRILDQTHIFPHKTDSKTGATAIFSKYPILTSGEIEFGTPTINCSWADIAIKNDTFRVYSYHFQSNQISAEEVNNIDGSELNKYETWSSMMQVLRRYKRHATKRAEQIETVKSHMDSSPYPIIAAGDLNDIPQSYAYRLFSKGICDSFTAQAFGIGKTYRGKIPTLRIDYIFASPELRIVSHKVPNLDYSDHNPVFSAFVKK